MKIIVMTIASVLLPGGTALAQEASEGGRSALHDGPGARTDVPWYGQEGAPHYRGGWYHLRGHYRYR
jgi:hypothetical protein